MEYKENALNYEDYCMLRESVGWQLFSEEQMRRAIANSLYTAAAVEKEYGGVCCREAYSKPTSISNHRTVGMGRLIGDGMYFMIVDVIVSPAFQKQGIGTNIINMLLKYVEDKTPAGGRSSVQLIAEKGKEPFYEKLGFKRIPHDFCGSGMRKVIRK